MVTLLPTTPYPRPRVLLILDHRLLSDCLTQVCTDAGFEARHAVPGDHLGVHEIAARSDVIIVSAHLQPHGGLHLVRFLTTSGVRVPILVLGDDHDSVSATEALHSGAHGFFGAHSSLRHVLAGITATMSGDTSMSDSCRFEEPSRGFPSSPLTNRETVILQLIADGLTIPEISSRLLISPKTVKHHLSSIYASLGSRDRTQAVVAGLRAGYITVSPTTA